MAPAEQDSQSTLQAVEARLVQQDAKIIEQEHRLFHVLYNWLNRKEWPQGDPRRIAASKALLLRIVFSPQTAVAGGALIALFTLAAIGYQNYLIYEQNKIAFETIRAQVNPRSECRANLLHTVCKSPEIKVVLLIMNSGDLPLALTQVDIVPNASTVFSLNRISGNIDFESESAATIVPPRTMQVVNVSFAYDEVLQYMQGKKAEFAVIRSLYLHAGPGMLADELGVHLMTQLDDENQVTLQSAETVPISPANDDELPIVKYYE